jgi:hypothetical protein
MTPRARKNSIATSHEDHRGQKQLSEQLDKLSREYVNREDGLDAEEGIRQGDGDAAAVQQKIDDAKKSLDDTCRNSPRTR